MIIRILRFIREQAPSIGITPRPRNVRLAGPLLGLHPVQAGQRPKHLEHVHATATHFAVRHTNPKRHDITDCRAFPRNHLRFKAQVQTLVGYCPVYHLPLCIAFQQFGQGRLQQMHVVERFKLI